MVNSEEMGWASAEGALGIAGAMIKSHVRDAAQGIGKTFAFDLFCTGSIYNASSFDYKGNVLPLYAAYRTMTHRLEHAKFIADLSTAEMEAYLFDRQGTPVIVVWSEKNKETELPLETDKAELINLMDVSSVQNTKNGKLRVKSTTLPQFIEGGKMDILTLYAKALKIFPHEIVIAPGKSRDLSFSPELSLKDLNVQLPEQWQAEVKEHSLRISVPDNTALGIYETLISFSIDGNKLSMPMLIEANNCVQGRNLVKNGDFSGGSSYWFYPKKNEEFSVIKGAGINGTNALKTKGCVFFGSIGSLKVRQGEKYALIAEAKGKGAFGCVYSVYDKNGKKLFPKEQGINCLNGRVENDWKTFGDSIVIAEPDAASMEFAVLANHADKNGAEIYFNSFAIVRLANQITLNKALWNGVCERTTGMPSDWNKIPAMTVNSGDNVINAQNTKWNGPNDLSASCRLAMDDSFLYLRFEVKDDSRKASTEKEIAGAWEYDSIQFSIDPTMEGKDYTGIQIAETDNGKVIAYKHANFWTPELPENITGIGLMSNVEINLERNKVANVYTIKMPLNELYPLSAKTKEFGFSWLVNDNDGSGRKYIQWSSGIGPQKDPKFFGLVKCESGL